MLTPIEGSVHGAVLPAAVGGEMQRRDFVKSLVLGLASAGVPGAADAARKMFPADKTEPYRESIPGFRDGGETTLTMDFDPDPPPRFILDQSCEIYCNGRKCGGLESLTISQNRSIDFTSVDDFDGYRELLGAGSSEVDVECRFRVKTKTADKLRRRFESDKDVPWLIRMGNGGDGMRYEYRMRGKVTYLGVSADGSRDWWTVDATIAGHDARVTIVEAMT